MVTRGAELEEIDGKLGYLVMVVTKLGRPLLLNVVVLSGEIKGMEMVAMEMSLESGTDEVLLELVIED